MNENLLYFSISKKLPYYVIKYPVFSFCHQCVAALGFDLSCVE